MTTQYERNLTFAGISIVSNGKDKEYHLHTTTLEDNTPLGVWLNPPCKVSHEIIKLPRKMDKIQAAMYLKDLKGFGDAGVRAYLEDRIEKMKGTQKLLVTDKKIRKVAPKQKMAA